MTQLSPENSNSTVCLDGSAVKRCREDHKLTQLYVSKVVGVTTDTISRWENNRYPSIRRENAIKLAEALESPLEDILKKPELPQVQDETGDKRPLLLLMSVALVVGVVIMSLVNMLSSDSPLPTPVTAERVLPVYAAPGAAVPVQVKLTYRTKAEGFILREYFPKGWKVLQAYPPASSLDNVNGIARWIIKESDRHDRIVYLLQADRNLKGPLDVQLQGEVVAGKESNQTAVPVQGESKMTIGVVHWADADGDGSINDVEMLQASYTVAEMEGVHIDWEQLEDLWDAGSYRWEKKKGRFVPKVIEADTPGR
jgi:DNA-binding XRE family transcriptional regulator